LNAPLSPVTQSTVHPKATSPNTRIRGEYTNADQQNPKRQGSGDDASSGDECVIRTRAGTVINDHTGLVGVAHIMGRGRDNAEEKEWSVYQPSLQSEFGGSQSN
jgi:alpha-D-ribose 1-methylphosphonate 5-triphosphate synthase subunit PhnG